MRILVLNYEFPPVGGGGGRAAEDICRFLAARGHSVTVRTAHYTGLPKYERRDGYEIFRTLAFRRRMDRCTVPEMAAFLVTAFLPTLRDIRSRRPDVMHVHFAVPTGALGFTASKITGVPYVMTTQLGDVPGGVPDQTDRLFRFLKPFTVPIWRNASAITAVSDHIRDLGMNAYNVNVETLPNGIDMTNLEPGSHAVHNPVRLVFAGRFNSQKNLGLLMDVLGRMSDLSWHLSMIGDGDDMPLVRNKIDRFGLGDRVTLHGWVSPKEVDRVMSQSDILVMPSRSEGLPIVGLRALALGLAVVGSDVGGIQEIVTDNVNGRLVRAGDAAGFEQALRALISSGERIAGMKKESSNLAGRFDLNRITDRFEELYEHAVGNRSHTPHT